jgi:hypothetical protein
MRGQRLTLYELPDYKPRLGRHNDYGYDLVEQQSQTYTGMGEDINVHDQWAVESMGRIQDRTREHLGTTDKGIVAYRTMLLKQIRKVEQGERPLLDLTAEEAAGIADPGTVDGVAPEGADVEAYWRGVDARRRAAAPWAAARVTTAAQ